MSSKDKILNRIRKSNIVEERELPDMDRFNLTFEDKFETFSTMLTSVGGEALMTDNLDETVKSLYPEAKVIASNVEQSSLATIKQEELDDPHKLEKVDVAIVKGEFAVAENGAVWLKNSSNRHRALYFIAENVVIVLSKNDILNNMHEAYKKIDFEKPGFGVFISGPSKTADIEQALVIGAHGAKSTYVLFV